MMCMKLDPKEVQWRSIWSALDTVCLSCNFVLRRSFAVLVLSACCNSFPSKDRIVSISVHRTLSMMMNEHEVEVFLYCGFESNRSWSLSSPCEVRWCSSVWVELKWMECWPLFMSCGGWRLLRMMRLAEVIFEKVNVNVKWIQSILGWVSRCGGPEVWVPSTAVDSHGKFGLVFPVWCIKVWWHQRSEHMHLVEIRLQRMYSIEAEPG